jgi:hypothetical protein
MNLGENTYKRKGAWERKRRVVIDETREWKPYPNLPIAPGLPDVSVVETKESYKLGGRPTRSNCEDTRDEDECWEEEESYKLGGRPTRSNCEDTRDETKEWEEEEIYKLGGRPTRSNCEDTRDEEEVKGMYFNIATYKQRQEEGLYEVMSPNIMW